MERPPLKEYKNEKERGFGQHSTMRQNKKGGFCAAFFLTIK